MSEQVSFLDHVAVVLVEPRVPGNIGATARAMRNMGLSKLILVNPADFLDVPEARWMAHMSEDLLEKARVCVTLEEALRDAVLVVGTTSRRGKHRGSIYPPKEAAQRVAAIAQDHEVAVLFGREDRGLLNQELLYCHLLTCIPTARPQPSLNLAQAVLLFGYELFLASRDPPCAPKLNLAPFHEMERLYARIHQTLTRLGFVPRNTPETFDRSVRRVLGRAQLERRDVATLHRICSEVDRYVDAHERAGT